MNVFQVKNVIMKTECADYVYSGLFCSEPIMSKDINGKIVDNYIVFSRSDDCKFICPPECIFGIYTDIEKSAYINDAIPKDFSEHIYEEVFADDESMRQARERYLEVFPEVRDMYQQGKELDTSFIVEYVESLRILSGDTLFSFYKKLFPSFFEWAKTFM